MAKISINLLPPETIAEELKRAKFYKVQFVGVIIVLTMVFIASMTMSLRILQSRHVAMAQASLDQAQQQVTNLKSTQASLFVLKDRLSVINQYLGVPSKQSSIYQLINKLIPPSIAITGLTIGKDNEVVLLASVPDSNSLDVMINNLSVRDNNEDKFSQISIESLNRGRDGLYRVSFKIKPK